MIQLPVSIYELVDNLHGLVFPFAQIFMSVLSFVPCQILCDFAQCFLLLRSVFCCGFIGHFQTQAFSSPRLWNLEAKEITFIVLFKWSQINGHVSVSISALIHKYKLDLKRWTVTSLHKRCIRAIQTKGGALDLSPRHQRRLGNTLRKNIGKSMTQQQTF